MFYNFVDFYKCTTSLRNIVRSLSSGGHKVSVPTIDIIIQGLLDSFLMYKCDRYIVLILFGLLVRRNMVMLLRLVQIMMIFQRG